MTTADYIVLTDSLGVAKRFYADGYNKRLVRSQTAEGATSGRLSTVTGRAREVYEYVLLAPQATSDSNWGTIDDLDYYGRLTNPSGTPSDVITLTRHDGTEKDCKILGDLDTENTGVVLMGNNAYYRIPVTLADVTRAQAGMNAASSSYFAAIV